MYSQDSKDKALGMLRLTGDVEKTARMSGVPGRTLRRWAAAAAKPRQRSRGAKFEPYGGEVRGKAMEMARGGASCREIAEALGIGSPDVVRYWLKGGGTKEARMGGRARTPEGDEPAYAGFEGGLEERIDPPILHHIHYAVLWGGVFRISPSLCCAHAVRKEHLSHQNHMSACGAAMQVLCKRFARLSAALLCLL